MDKNSLALKNAAFGGDLNEVKRLIESGADVNAADESGSGTLLNFHPPVTAFLLANGANPDLQTNENGASVLAGLCYVNQTECVRLILEHGANPNLGRADSGETPLHHALANNAGIGIIQLLIDHGAKVNAKTKPDTHSYNFFGDTRTCEETPLHRAAAYAPIEIIKLLLHSGADPQCRDANGDQPHQWAGKHRRSKEIVELLFAQS